ncbi:ring canal kelch homolog [Macrobrachium nipponense]|uniref:ring canal kelch homolog n=1 Tax=Macrobrachium nipponense TaxID=159736 RepID=UPI0030C8850B
MSPPLIFDYPQSCSSGKTSVIASLGMDAHNLHLSPPPPWGFPGAGQACGFGIGIVLDCPSPAEEATLRDWELDCKLCFIKKMTIVVTFTKYTYLINPFHCSSRLLLRHASQNSLDESSQKHIPRSETKHKLPYRNPQHFPKAFDNLNLMRRQSQLCDVVLIADSIEVPAHKMVLASCSPYFHAMFTSFEESRQDRIVLQDIDGNALQLLIDYVYTAEVLVTEENVQVLLPAANLLQLTDVRDACCDFLQSQLHPTNCLGIRAFADIHGCLELLSIAESYVEQHFTEVVECEEFLSLTSQQVIKLISSDRLTTPSEEKVFECVMSWVSGDLTSREQYLAELMEYVRLPLLPQDYLIQRVEEEPLLKQDTQCELT